MKCPHCCKEIHFQKTDEWIYGSSTGVFNDESLGYSVSHGFCPACEKMIVLHQEGPILTTEGGKALLLSVRQQSFLYPKGASRLVEPEVPDGYAQDYREAASIVDLSSKASAALSRRILQTILHNECAINRGSLAQEIEEYLNLPGIPSHLSEAVDAIRNIGNFAAHPLKDTNTGEVVDVEEGEAAWLLEVLDAMFDFHFTQPRRLEERKSALNKKLEDLGKPRMKDGNSV